MTMRLAVYTSNEISFEGTAFQLTNLKYWIETEGVLGQLAIHQMKLVFEINNKKFKKCSI